jgi:hypothetical protein
MKMIPSDKNFKLIAYIRVFLKVILSIAFILYPIDFVILFFVIIYKAKESYLLQDLPWAPQSGPNS